MIVLETLAGWSAIVAAVATVVGALFLILFFTRGQPWGTLNDIASIVLMVATIPVAIAIAALELESVAAGAVALAIAAVGIAGMLVAGGLQTALVLGIRTYEQLVRRTLGAGVVVGVWYLLAGLFGMGILGGPLVPLMLASGAGYVAVGYGFAVGGQQSRLAAAGGLVLAIASTAFLLLFGAGLLDGTIPLVRGDL